MTSVQNADILCLDGNAEISLDINTVIQGHCQQHAENNIAISFLYVGRIIGNIPNTLRWSVPIGIGLSSTIMLFTKQHKTALLFEEHFSTKRIELFSTLKDKHETHMAANCRLKSPSKSFIFDTIFVQLKNFNRNFQIVNYFNRNWYTKRKIVH